MLVLSRRMNESIVIGAPENPIATVLIVSIGDGKVRVGITANKAIPVHRHEVADEIVEIISKGATS